MRSLPSFLFLLLVMCATLSAQTATELAELKSKAGKGDAESQFQLGYYYLGKDHKEAGVWYRKAADNGLPQAQSNLASILMLGMGEVPADHIEGFKWFKKAAVTGHERSQMGVAIAYYTGRGAPKDYVEAYRRGLRLGEPRRGQRQGGEIQGATGRHRG